MGAWSTAVLLWHEARHTLVMKGRFYESRVRDHVVHLGLNVNGSAHNCGCVVNGGNTMAAI